MKKTNTGKKKKVNKFTFFCILVVFILVISYVMFGIIGLMKNPSSTVIVKEGTVTKEETVTGVIIRDETIVQVRRLLLVIQSLDISQLMRVKLNQKLLNWIIK